MDRDDLFLRLGLALAIGFLIGLERGWKARDEEEGQRTAGLRTYSLISLLGGIFAAFAFSISVFSIPMVLDKKFDAFTAMGTSMSIVWNNLPVMLLWGAIVLSLTVIALVSGMIGFVIIFPLLGHATWHAYVTMRDPD